MSGRSLDDWHAHVEAAASGVIGEVLKHLPPGGVFFDVGANTGAVSHAAIEARDAAVYAWEPVPEYAAYARRINPTARVYEKALGEAPAILELWRDGQNLGWNTFATQMLTAGMEPLRVQVLPLDLYFDLPAPDVLKIDTEGWEWAVLRGGHGVLKDWKPVIIVELGWGRNHPRRADVEAELEWLFSIGYERIDYDAGGTQDFTLIPA